MGIREGWTGPDGPLGRHIEELNRRCLAAYNENPALVEEHANAERIQTEGGYGRRQVWELIQNGADEMLDDPGRVEVVLTDGYLYCANEGKAVTPEGAGAILSAYRSAKRGPEIGRFGLGFKSVLGVSSAPQFFSRSGSFAWNPQFARELIERVVGPVDEVPTLRLAMNLDAEAIAAADARLRELMGWATTVVRLPLDLDTGEWLHTDLIGFPSEFLVFSPHIATLVLDDADLRRRREIRLEPGPGAHEHRLVEEDSEDVWTVFSTDFRPSDAAARDAGAMAHRELIRLQWAVPVKARQRIGGLWAYFPTLEETTLSGVLNAPWKLNDDRTRVIEGPFNLEILEQATDLVLANLEVLTARDDPGNILDILPARGREERNWADGHLTERINAKAAVFPTIPDQTGELTLPATLTLHPSGLDRNALRAWSKVPTRPVNWAHWSVDINQTRRSRAERFMEASPGGRRATLGSWLEALVPHESSGLKALAQASGHALIVASMAAAGGAEALERIRQARIVMDADGDLATPAEVLLPGDHEVIASGIRFVHPALARNQKARAALHRLHVRDVDAALELQATLAGRRPGDLDQDWDEIWRVARRAAPREALSVLENAGFTADALRVRTVAGRYLPVPATLLPGDIATPQNAPGVVVDVEHHRGELDLLRLLGSVSAPAAGGAREHEPAMRAFRRQATEAFAAKIPRGNPDLAKVILQPGIVAGPLTPLERLEGTARARYTTALLEAQPTFLRCEVSYPNNRYPPITVEHPVVQLVRRHGIAQTSAGLVEITRCVGPQLRTWAAILPVAALPPAAADALGLPDRLDELDEERWGDAYARAAQMSDCDTAARFYASACRAGAPVPTTLLASVGDGTATVETHELRVTASARNAAVLAAGACPHLVVEGDDVELLVGAWGCRRGDDEIASEIVAIEAASRVLLIDLFPALRRMLDDGRQRLEVAWCSEIRIDISGAGGRQSESTRFQVDRDVAYVDETLEPPQLLRLLSDRLGLGLDVELIDKIIENKQTEEIRARVRDIRRRRSPEEKLAIVVTADRLRGTLPASLLTALSARGERLDHTALARLAFAVHGVETLRTFLDEFDEQGLQPPKTWAGSRPAVDWVTHLGFGREQAGFPGARRDRTLEVDGPPALNELHPYQRNVADKIRQLLRRDPSSERPRGMVSLPTGAGKTRVVIEALVEAVKAGELGSPVLWVAQRDELCEQAVQAWSEVWRDRGPNDRLTVSRLWATNEAEVVTQGAQVVIATIQKLASGIMESRAYDWLERRATCIVVDEAHFAITPHYTRLLAWQGMDRRKERAPLIGMTATPYRGTSEEETTRLIHRFGERLDMAAFGHADPYQELQSMGVLSRVEHRTLRGSSIRLSADEIAELSRTRLLPSSASDRLAADVERNRELLDSVTALGNEFTALMFCTSLEHASVMAGLLTAEGVPAAAVSGTTAPAVRRHYVEEFRAGRLRVLTNYGVFQEGFDAPMVRAVYVARPTYSPNVYQQMIGRGLRGPLNGGSEECLIVNVEDNVENFGEELAFRKFENLWEPAAA